MGHSRRAPLTPNSAIENHQEEDDDTFLTVPAHWAIRSLPTCVEPVNESLRTIGFVANSVPTYRASHQEGAGWCGQCTSAARDLGHVTTFSTPLGTPARSASSQRASAVNGVSSAGLMTAVQPTARAGPTLRVIIAAGKFQGVTIAQTPIGSLTANVFRSLVAEESTCQCTSGH